MNHRKTQIDFILVSKKWKNSVKNVEAYNTFSSIGSDHRVLTARIKMSFRKTKTPKRATIYDWSVLKYNKQLQERYTVTVKNRFNALCQANESATQIYDHFVKANKESAEEFLPCKEKTKNTNIAKDPRVEQARKNVVTTFENFQNNPVNANQAKLQVEKDKLQQVYDSIREEELAETLNRIEAEDRHFSQKKSWKIINEVSGRKTTKSGILSGNNKEDRVKNWHLHFSELLGKVPIAECEDEDIISVIPQLEYPVGPFTKDEYLEAKSALSDGKSAGPDSITPELLKYCDFDNILLELANRLLLNGEKPQQWSTSNIIPIPKKGDLSKASNYRGISLSSVSAKLINRMILNRIQPVLDPHLRQNQNGFRPGRSTAAHILALRRLIEGVKHKNLSASITFIDFKKAFDSIHRGKMFKILKAYGIPNELVSAIAKIYDDVKARIVTPDGETELIEILAGVLQGDTLAPYLFIIVLDYAMRDAVSGKEEELGFQLRRRMSRRHPAKMLTDLDFADDIALVSETTDQAQKMLQNVEKATSKVGLYLNAAKTEVMLFNQTTDSNLTSRSGETIKAVKNFKYLGAWMSSSQDDIAIRKAVAWKACHKLKKFWTSRMHRNTKVRLFLSAIEPILLYGCETWTMTKAVTKSIDGCYTRMLRMVQNISWSQHMTNTELYHTLPKLSTKIRQRRMNLAGHCVRHIEEEASNLVLWQPDRGTASRGRRTATFIDTLLDDTNLQSSEEVATVMKNRDAWRGVVNLVRSRTRPR